MTAAETYPPGRPIRSFGSLSSVMVVIFVVDVCCTASAQPVASAGLTGGAGSVVGVCAVSVTSVVAEAVLPAGWAALWVGWVAGGRYAERRRRQA